MAGLALREGGVQPDDPAVRRAAGLVRQRAPNDPNTYDLALSIMFLDKLTRAGKSTELRAVRGAAGPRAKRLKSGRTLVGQQVDDSELIVRLCRRLQNGQGPGGTWSYQCTSATDGDHSNTQFGVLGLWVGGQHGVDVAENLRRCAEHFRKCQSTKGGWDYTGSGGDSASMTAAGLIALAVATGLEAELRSSTDLRNLRSKSRRPKDPNIQAGLECLERFLTPVEANAGPHRGSPFGGFGRGLGAFAVGMGSSQDLYFLWSLERVGVLYGLKTVGKVDWYRWGTYILLTTQQQDGSWRQSYSPEISTSFAILFLTRANVAPELSQLLAGKSVGGGAQMQSLAPGTDPMQALGLKKSISELLSTLAETSDRGQREAVLRELAQRRPKYLEVKDQLDEILPLASSPDASVAQAAKDQLANAFQRAPMSHCLYYLGEADALVGKLIWAQVDARIARADAARRAGYRDTAVEVLGHKEFSQAGRAAAVTLLGKLKDTGVVGPVAELVPQLPRELWPAVGRLLSQLTGEDFGPHPGDGFAQAYEAGKRWQAWAKEKGDGMN